MAKRKKNEPRERAQLPPQATLGILGVFALLALLGGIGILWQSWQANRAGNTGPQLKSLQETLAHQIDDQVGQLHQRLDALVKDPYLQADMAVQDFSGATRRLAEAWTELEDIEVFDPDLDTAFEADLSEVGFGKLALLTGAANERASMVDVVGRGDLDLGMAAPIVDETGTLMGVAFAALPLNDLIQPVRAASIPGGYLELRSGQRILVEKGDPQWRRNLAYTNLTKIPLRMGTGAPEYVASLPYSPGTQALLGLAALFLAGILGWRMWTTLTQLQGKGATTEPTLAEALRRGEAGAPASARPTAKTGASTASPAVRPSIPVSVTVDRSIFRAYDIRGVLGQTLNEDVARLIGQAIGTVMAERGLQEIVVGRDGRLSGPALSEALIEGLRLTGRDVYDIGQAPTPVVYFASYQLQTGSCVAVTGSHNPPDYNGFKIVLGGETLSGEAIEDLYLRIADHLLDDHGDGGLQTMDVAGDYIARISDDVFLERPLKVVVDAGNGVAGAIAPQVLEAIGAEVMQLYCDVDGEFPNHHPDPSDPENLQDLRHFVNEYDAEIGLAFDGDGDRLGVVTRSGEIIYPDRLLMLFARDVLSRNPGATIIYDVKCTGHLAGQILRNGGSPVMWKTGHSLIKAKMRETEAELAGEMSGHFFFRERWYGFDDGIYAAARLLEIIAGDGRSADEILTELPKGASTPELKVPMEEGAHYAFIKKFVAQAQFDDARISTIDGVRADWPDGWGLVRCSNTTPSLVLRFDADDEAALARIQEIFRAQLLAVDETLNLPF